MEFKDIVAVSGMGGLYEMVNARPDGMIVRQLGGSKTQFVSNRIHSFSPLDKIGIFTDSDTVDLQEVMFAILTKDEENGLSIPKSKADSASLKAFLKSVLPDYDEERVYVSDIKKIVKWYKILKEHKLITPIKEEETPEEEKADESSTEISKELPSED